LEAVYDEEDQDGEVKVTEKEWETWQAKAKANQMTLSEWIRTRCRGAGRPKPARKPIVD
jgi:hypothetical protein